MAQRSDLEEDEENALRWREMSRHLIRELNEKILHRRLALSQPPDESPMASDEDSVSVSSRQIDDYHRKKILDAELKLKMLEGFDTLSESSSLASSLCFQELEVRDDIVDEKVSEENINSHNSRVDGGSDSESVSYSASFSDSIEEDIESHSTFNADSNSTDINEENIPLQFATACDDEHCPQSPDTTGGDQKIICHDAEHVDQNMPCCEDKDSGITNSWIQSCTQDEIIQSNKAPHSKVDDIDNDFCDDEYFLDFFETKTESKPTNTNFTSIRESEKDKSQQPRKHEQNTKCFDLLLDREDTTQSGNISKDSKINPLFNEEEDPGILPQAHSDDMQHIPIPNNVDERIQLCKDVSECNDILDCDIFSRDNNMENNKDKSPKDNSCELPSSSPTNKRDMNGDLESALYDFNDLPNIFIDQEFEILTHCSPSNSIIPDIKFNKTNRRTVADCEGPYNEPTLGYSDLGGIFSSYNAVLSQLEGLKMNDNAFRDISCNKGLSDSESPNSTKKKSVITTSVTRRQSLLKETLNRPLQRCIEKARLVSSIKECVDQAKTAKDKVAGKIAYEKAVKDFKEAIDTLLIERLDQEKEDDISINDSTYSLDDPKVVPKTNINPLDVIRTPINKRRMAAKQEPQNKIENEETSFCDDTFIPMNSLPEIDKEAHENSHLKRATTFVLHPKSKSDHGKCVFNVDGVEIGNLNPDNLLNQVTRYLGTEKIVDNDEFDTDTYQIPPQLAGGPDGFATTQPEAIDNEDTAYASGLDCSAFVLNDETFNKDVTYSIGEKALPSHNDKLSDVKNDDDHHNSFELEEQNRQLSDETLDIVDPFCNAGDFINVDENTSIHDGDANLQSLTSFDEPLFVITEEENQSDRNAEISDAVHASKTSRGAETFDKNDTDVIKDVDATEELLISESGEKCEEALPPIFQSTDPDALNIEYYKGDVTKPLSSKYMVDYKESKSCDHVPGNDKELLDKLHISIQSPHKHEGPEDNIVPNEETSPQFLNNKGDQTNYKVNVDIDQEAQTEILSNASLAVENPEKDDLNETVSKSNQNPYQKVLEDKSIKTSCESASGKPELCQKESFFSITSSSSSGEYYLLNQGAPKSTTDVTPFSSPMLYSPQVRDEVNQEHVQDFNPSKLDNGDIFKVNYPPNEMLIRQKSADDIEKICVENRQIFERVNEHSQTFITKHEKRYTQDKPYAISQNISLQNTDSDFENSISDLRKAALDCLGPLREKVAFFENIEKTLQSNDTLIQRNLGFDNSSVAQRQVHITKPINGVSDSKEEQRHEIPLQLCTKCKNVSQKDATVQVNEVVCEQQDDLTTFACKIGDQDDLHNMMALVERVISQISDTNNSVERLRCSFQDAFQNVTSERDQIKDSLNTLTSRIALSEGMVLEKLASLEESIAHSETESSTGFQMVQKGLEKLRCDNTENMASIKHVSSDVGRFREDFEETVEKLATEFKEQIRSVHKALDEYQESKPGPSISVHDAPSASFKRDGSSNLDVDNLRMRVIEMKNQRDAEKMYHKITRESLRALERDHDRLRQELLMAAARRRLGERKKSSHLSHLTHEALPSINADDIEIKTGALKSMPTKLQDNQSKRNRSAKADVASSSVSPPKYQIATHLKRDTQLQPMNRSKGKREKQSKKELRDDPMS